MTIHELNREQLIQIKQAYYTRKQEEAGQGVSYQELAEIDALVTDAEIKEAYEGIDFVQDDFFA